ncbi:transcriptional regulator, MerR family [Clostridium sp. DL-VIII]|uniref:MerR family transcriptional regulator n=1 Tax=Clostridium sp. DL-VIII TaxID=641107 RepID=UPI00023AFFA4|nr:MerR family transcriptional regulator [Clostridium sp. DL-VIII]EHI99129.1 transcriptional regulator, MerR family [Clostridium sp. DL-VIII]
MAIAEINEKRNTTINTLHYYEHVGVIPYMNCTTNEISNYTKQDCEWIYFTKCMRSAVFSIATLIDYVLLFQQDDVTVDVRKKLLIEHLKKLVAIMEDMCQILERLNYEIERYEQVVVPRENTLKI